MMIRNLLILILLTLAGAAGNVALASSWLGEKELVIIIGEISDASLEKGAEESGDFHGFDDPASGLHGLSSSSALYVLIFRSGDHRSLKSFRSDKCPIYLRNQALLFYDFL